MLIKTPQTVEFPCLGSVVQVVVVQSMSCLLQYFFSEPKGFVSLSTACILALLPEPGC